MTYQIESVQLFVRQIPPPRMDFAIGKGASLFPEWMRANVEAQVELSCSDGRSAAGFSADWPSFGWLDKRQDVRPRQKLVDLLRLINVAAETYASLPPFASPFEGWWQACQQFQATEVVANSVSLCATFAGALIERAVIDAFCRLQQIGFHEALKYNRFEMDLARIHAETANLDFDSALPNAPAASIQIKHTVGPTDPLTDAELTAENRLADGLPQTLESYRDRYGITFFKIKICGDPASDFQRLKNIWTVVRGPATQLTLDGNEAYDQLDALRGLLDQLARDTPELFERIRFIEQPMTRARTLDRECTEQVRDIARIKPLIIDEADESLYAFREAVAIGYSGVSHKNCKGVFKSVANWAMCKTSTPSESMFLSAEDLTVMPIVALHQDFAVIAALGLESAERNAHHFFSGLNHLSPAEQASAVSRYPRLYESTNTGVAMKIEQGRVDLSELDCVGTGFVDPPDKAFLQSGNPATPVQWMEQLEQHLQTASE